MNQTLPSFAEPNPTIADQPRAYGRHADARAATMESRVLDAVVRARAASSCGREDSIEEEPCTLTNSQGRMSR